ncbi:MAG: hypothetical protein Q9160_009165 [Pyrenula sp. 1 TL-2023]
MGLLCFFALVGGGISGSYWGIISPVCAEVIGLQELPAGLSITWVIIVAPTTFAEAIALELRSPGSKRIYLNVQLFTAFMYFGGALCIWLVRAWKVGELEETQRAKEDAIPCGGTVETERDVDGKREKVRDIVEAEATAIWTRGWKSRDLLRRLWASSRV